MSESGVLSKSPSELTEADIIYDWNALERRGSLFKHKISFFDETLRDGVQCPSVVDPKIEDKLKILHLMNDVGIDHVDIGLPGAGKRAQEDVYELGREIRDAKLRIKPACAARTIVNDIAPDRRDLAAARHADRGDGVHRLVADSPVRRGLEPRLHAQAVGRGDRLRGQERAALHLRHRGHDALAPRGAGDPVQERHRARRARGCASATPSGTPRPTASRT